MKNKISYLLMSVIFFNILFIFYYYFKIVNFFYINLFKFSVILNVLFINFWVLLIDVFILIFYYLFKRFKLSYFKMICIGLFIGGLMSFVLLGVNKYEFNDYIAVISYFVINTVFIFYSLQFEVEKIKVFE